MRELSIKDLCKEKKEILKLTNQDIADEADIPVSTINNYFSSASKAPSVYTVGPICSVLGVSLDQYFGIDPGTPEEAMEEMENLRKKCAELQDELTAAKEVAASEIKHSEEEIKKEEEHNQRMVNQFAARLAGHRIYSTVMTAAFLLILALFIAYLLHFDLPNAGYGIIRTEAFTN